eukprot:365244-Chlamydomonas_euryale.AAC.15
MHDHMAGGLSSGSGRCLQGFDRQAWPGPVEKLPYKCSLEIASLELLPGNCPLRGAHLEFEKP